MSETRQPNEDTRELDARVSALLDQMHAASNQFLQQLDETDPYPPAPARPDLFAEPGPAADREAAREPAVASDLSDIPIDDADGASPVGAFEPPAPRSAPPPAPPPPGPLTPGEDDLSRAVEAMLVQARAAEPPAPPALVLPPTPPAPAPPAPAPPAPPRSEPMVSAGSIVSLDDELAIFGDDLLDDDDRAIPVAPERPMPVQSHRPPTPAISATTPASAPPRAPEAKPSPLRTMPLAAAVAANPAPVRPAAPKPVVPPPAGKGSPANVSKPPSAAAPKPVAPAGAKPTPRPATPQQAPRKPLGRAAGAVAPVVLKAMDAASAPVRHKPNARRIAGYIAVITAFNALCLLAYNFLIREPRPPSDPAAEVDAAPDGVKKGAHTNDAGVEVSPRSKVKPAGRRKMMGSGGD